jgi:hypothetical protein
MPEGMLSGVAAAWPKYKCHKEVWALKILEVRGAEGMLIVEEPYGPINVGVSFIERHRPETGGYWVQYDDGYTSFSPARAFESGYMRIE